MSAANETINEFLRSNVLCEGFSDKQIAQLSELVMEISIPSGGCIIKENEISDDLFIIKEGEVSVEKWDAESQINHRLSTLGIGDIIGEITILDHAPRSASIYALKPTTLYAISFKKLRQLWGAEAVSAKVAASFPEVAAKTKKIAEEASFYSLLLQNLVSGLGKRLRSSNKTIIQTLRKELDHAKARVAMGMLIITIVVNLCLYIIVLKLLENFEYKAVSMTVIDAPLIAVLTIMILVMMAKSVYPMKFYGFTLKDWRISVLEGVVCAFAIMFFTVVFKWLLINYTQQFANHDLFEMYINMPSGWLWTFVYLLFIPLQELIVRGGLQSSFQDLLVGPHKYIWAVLLSNLLFSVIHFHVSIILGVSVFLPGLIWGWMYARHRTLIGVSVSHMLAGFWALSVVGI